MVTDLEIRLSIWSKASAAKSPNIISTIAWSPASARPPATPVMPASLIGVESTRSGWRADRPRVTLKAPPYGSRTSSPSRCSEVRSSNRRSQGRVERLHHPRARGEDTAGRRRDGGRRAQGTDDPGSGSTSRAVDVELTGPEGPATDGPSTIVGCDAVNSTVQ
ncbi:hypothetical protein SALBM217S_00520 [Streptomyces griseoloalbus]